MFNAANIPESVKKYLPGDFLATNPSAPLKNNFLLQNRFIFSLTRCPTASFYLQRVNLPSVSIGITPQANPTSVDIRRPGNRYVFEDLTISFPVDEDMKNYNEVFSWIKGLAPWDSNTEALSETQKTSDATLFVLSGKYNPIAAYKFYNIFPSFLSGLDFDITLNDSEVMIASAVFTYTHFDIFTDTNLS